MAKASLDQYLTFLTEPDAATILQRSKRTETYYDDSLAVDVLRNKYLAPGEEGPLDLWERVARALASVEEDPGYWFEEFFAILFDFKFVPASTSASPRAPWSIAPGVAWAPTCRSCAPRVPR
jgi:ribonucleotide reductase alpha subunit